MKKLLLIVLIIFTVFNCSQKENQIQMAKEHIEKIGKNPTTRDINEMYDNGKIYYGSNPEMAMLYFERVVKDKPEASNYLAEYYYNKKDYANYEKWAKYAADRGISPATHNFAYYYEQKGDIENATKYYLIAAKNGDKDSKNDVILLYIERGNDEETKKILAELGEEGTENELMLRKASHYKRRKEYNKSIEIYKKMIEKGYSDGYMGWGLLLNDMGKRDEAINIYKKGIEKGNIHSMCLLGNIYVREKNYKEAEKYYFMVLEKNDKHYNQYSMGAIAWCKEQTGDYKQAKEWYKKAVNNGLESQKYKIEEMEEKLKYQKD
ncbi:tetratricopeptide repeat protein [Leptotrichia buccalis]|uniref:Sel1 domain protein repeat-containing protein n=1 Tax=Leptotrichia buccalis (strain ATCC 14201 / DSM 1135 / JCM 12969 / NCTC 10249 / C-1013-b) TaxID=523794 RepID=C7N9K3_LEPBD|nr:tetratricopeptide repeat protein [Leptotrichia buccalis]ACV38834.1 Sel1 domain protein repeat-containing protein [Leptotrichia buccalis C-1013-b]